MDFYFFNLDVKVIKKDKDLISFQKFINYLNVINLKN